jgi:hypothetical protein
MKSNRTTHLILGFTVLCFTVSLLRAAEIAAVNGSFTLPSQTYWGPAVLPAGNYTFTLDHSDLRGQILIRQGMKVIARVLVQGPSVSSFPEGSSMLIMDHSVRSLRLAPIGLTYIYPIQKRKGEMLARRPGVPGVYVSVSTRVNSRRK